jgi:hypothetical protein
VTRDPFIAGVGRRVLHHGTFETFLVPALADAQYEAAAGRRRRFRDAYGMLHALLGGLSFDLWRDVTALGADLDTISVLTVLQASYYGFMLLLLSGLGTARVSMVDVDRDLASRLLCYLAAVGVASLATSSACVWPARQKSED